MAKFLKTKQPQQAKTDGRETRMEEAMQAKRRQASSVISVMPTQEVATIPRAAGNPQSAYKAARADLDRVLATMGQFDTQQDLPAHPYTLDASSWNKSQKNQFLQGKDQIRSAK